VTRQVARRRAMLTRVPLTSAPFSMRRPLRTALQYYVGPLTRQKVRGW
jgi:hypothetical protein